MIIVTGIPRSGTSAAMQTLKLLNVPVAGEKFPAHEIPELNPKGFYELDAHTLISGISDNRYQGMAVKMVGYGLLSTNRKFISKVIVMNRNKAECQRSLLNSFRAGFMKSATAKDAEHAYILCNNVLDDFLNRNSVPTLRIQLEDLTKYPITEITRICEFIGINSNIGEAVSNIDRRS
jgi:hypothetical protein